MRALIIAALAFTGGCAQNSTPKTLHAAIACERETGAITLTIGGRTIDRLNDDDAPARLTAAIGPGDPEIRLHAARETPYRCIGGLVFNLQRAGFTKIAFIAEPLTNQEAEQ